VSEHKGRIRPGNRVVRRRMAATSVIELPLTVVERSVPNATTHAKQFALGVGLIILLGTVLLMLPIATESGEMTHPVDALFTSISATAVTGLTTVDTQDHWSFFGELVILVMIQLGGFGFMVGTSLILIALGRGGSLRDSLMVQDGSPTMTLRDVTTLSIRILKFIVVCEAIGAVLLTFHFVREEPFLRAVWYGIFYSISAFCNAGFDLAGGFRSISGYHTYPLIIMTLAVLVQLGALSYLVFADLWKHRGRFNRLMLDTKLVLITNVGLVLGATILFLLVEWNSALALMSDGWKPMNALFEAMSGRTAGFSSVNFGDANSSTLYLWVAAMMVGGAPGSTAGGIKLATLAVIMLAVISTLRGQEEPQAFGRRIGVTVVFRALSIAVMFLVVHFILAVLLVLSEDIFNQGEISFVALMFEAMSALATVGLTTGITPDLSMAGKLLLCVGMFIGRLGPITAAYALQRRQMHQRYRFPEAHVRLG
jgi:trk system potassium uptake protein TrkH